MFSLFQEHEAFFSEDSIERKKNFNICFFTSFISFGLLLKLIIHVFLHKDDFVEHLPLMLINLNAWHNQYWIFWILYQCMIDLDQINFGLKMASDMFTIKEQDKKISEKFKKTQYYKNKIYIQQDQSILNFYEMPVIDVTDLGSIRTAFLFRSFVWEKGKQLTLLYQEILFNIIFGILLQIIAYGIGFKKDFEQEQFFRYMVGILIPFNFLPYSITFCYYMSQIAVLNDCFTKIRHSLSSSRNLINSL